MATVTVNSSAGLLAALKTAHGGDTILLASGTYAANIYKFNAGGTVNITSASASNPAIFSSLSVNTSSGLKFSNLTLATTLTNPSTSASAATPFQVLFSNNVTFNNVSVHGTMDNNPQDDVNGLIVDNSSNITITNSTFQQLFNAISQLNNTNVVITNNSIHDIRNDGIDGGGTSNLVVSGNSFTNFYPVGAVGSTGDHADAIQFWTAGTTSDASNIVISNNSFVRGSGSVIQGIFVTAQSGLEFHNVTVTGNSIIGSEYNAITVSGADNVNVSSNLVEDYADMQNYIWLANVTHVTMNNNVAPAFQLQNVGFISQLANQTIGVVTALTSAAALNTAAPVTAVAEAATVNERQTLTGNALIGDQGSGLYLADVGIGAATQKVVGTSGSATFTGTYGTLTVQQNGSYSYTATKEGLTVGQVYDDHFTLTVASPHGAAQSSTLDVLITGSATGTAAVNTIVGGAGTETINGMGGADSLTSGTGPDTFAFNSGVTSNQAAYTTIKGFKAGDTIDLSAVDPSFHVVTALDGHAHELVIRNDGNGQWDIYGDINGSGTTSATADFLVHLTGATTTLVAADIHL